MRYVFDIETNGYLLECDKLWCNVAYDLDSRKLLAFEYQNNNWKPLFEKAKMLIGHNITGFDIPALEKLTGLKLDPNVVLIDTLIISQVLDYYRFGDKGHSLEAWGEFLGFPKTEFNDFDEYTPEMLEYNKNDVLLNLKIYNVLMKELADIAQKQPFIKTYLRAEHYAALWNSKARVHGWPFDVEKGVELFNRLESEINNAKQVLESKLGLIAEPVDKYNGIALSKRPKWIKNGCYDAHTARWFDVDPFAGVEDRPIDGEFTRIRVRPLSLNSVTDVKVFLFRNGWKPTQYNFKRMEDRSLVQTSPKITEDSLEFLGGDGKLYTDFASARARHAILKTWLDNVDENGMLHGDAFPIGTPSMRTRHSIIANVPSSDAPWGKEMRSLFKSLPGWSLIGADSKGNQARGLAHYLANEDFINTLLNGDIHQYNADVLTNVLKSMKVNHVVPRSAAKRILYAFLFGASGAKLWMYIFGELDRDKGNKLKRGFLKKVPGFKELIDSLAAIFGQTSKFGKGYIYSIAGNKIYVDSHHKLLVYLLQACEKVTCSTALMLTVQEFEKRNIPYIPCIYYHDEIDFMVPDEYSEVAAEIARNAFAEGPKMYGIKIMDGDSKIGKNWLEVH
jgi:DNA polymerase-1